MNNAHQPLPLFQAVVPPVEPLPPRKKQKRPHASKSTSRDAFRANRPRQGSQRDRAYRAILAAGRTGMTRAEITAETGILYASISSVVAGLITANLVVETTETRPTPTGSAAHVLVAIAALANPDREVT